VRVFLTLASIFMIALLAVPACGLLDSLPSAYATLQPVILVGIGAEQDAGRISAEDAERARVLVAELGRALAGGTVADARTIWERLLPIALAGIDSRLAAGEIGPGVAAGLREALRLFGERLASV
jgi:hypothetical protein